jgi:hypothetical protein
MTVVWEIRSSSGDAEAYIVTRDCAPGIEQAVVTNGRREVDLPRGAGR